MGAPPHSLSTLLFSRGRPPRTRPYPRSVPVASGPLGKHPSGGAGFPASQTARSLGVYPLPSNPGWPRTRGGAAQRCAEGEPEHVTIPPQHPAMLEAPSGLSQVSQAPVMINVCRVFAKALIRVYKYAFGKIDPEKMQIVLSAPPGPAPWLGLCYLFARNPSGRFTTPSFSSSSAKWEL